MGDYLRFRDATPEGRKTKVIHVTSYRGDTLGEIKWYGGWRQYVFAPAATCIFNPDCMEEICRVIKRLMIEWRKSIKTRPTTQTSKHQMEITGVDSELG